MQPDPSRLPGESTPHKNRGDRFFPRRGLFYGVRVDNSLKPCENPGDVAVDWNMRHSRARGWYTRGLCSLALCTFVASSSKAGQTAVPRSIAAEANSVVASDQTPSSQEHVHGAPSDWSLGLDGVTFATFDGQGGRRGETQFNAQNWFMAMGMGRLPLGTLTLSAGLSAEPFTVGKAGYSEIFQVGEAFHNLQVTDRQHPHDLVMQLAGAWRVPIGKQVSYTLAGGVVGEPALGPVAFIHRASSSENPAAPLSHHIFDSTHITTGVVTMGADRGPFAIEGSVFRGREPDEDRYDVDFGALDSWSARVWFRPASEWAIQGSHGYLHEPEQLEPGDQRRTNGSVSWLRERGSNFLAATAAVGRNARRFSTVRALLLEITGTSGRTSLYGRFEALTVETEILLFPQIVHRPHPGELVDPLRELTSGIVRDVADIHGFRVGIGGDVVFYGVPDFLKLTHDPHPASYHVFVRVRPPARGGRMWNMTMGQPMGDSTNGHHGVAREP